MARRPPVGVPFSFWLLPPRHLGVMTELGLRPRSATELVDAAFQVFRRDPMQFIVATAAVYVPWLVIRLAFDVGISTAFPTPQQALVAGLAGVVVYAAVGGVITVIASDVYLG